jgi:putative two-component system response regulator
MMNEKPTILVVDDVSDNVELLGSILKGRYRVKAAIEGRKAIEIALGDDPPDLILLDIVMPAVDGYEVCARLKDNPRAAEIPVIFLTAKADAADEEKGLALGAVDYIAKPISPAIVLARVATHLSLKRARDFLKDKNAFLEAEVARRIAEVGLIQDVAMIAMGSLAETRDNETGDHIRRTQCYIKVLAKKLQGHPRFADRLPDDTIELLYKSAPLHDIGKVGIPDNILKKPGKLDPDEFEIMKTHAALGKDSIAAAERRLDSPTSFLAFAREIAWSHHEKWDGAGYPRGLAGEDIPLAGRLMAIPDVYDALISERVYKKALPHETAVRIIEEGAGSQFDPDMIYAFEEIEKVFQEIACAYSDSPRYC